MFSLVTLLIIRICFQELSLFDSFNLDSIKFSLVPYLPRNICIISQFIKGFGTISDQLLQFIRFASNTKSLKICLVWVSCRCPFVICLDPLGSKEQWKVQSDFVHKPTEIQAHKCLYYLFLLKTYGYFVLHVCW